MADVKISELSLAAAAGDSVVPASNAAGNLTSKVTLQSIANLANPATIGAATQSDIDASIASLVDSAPAALNTLNELAAALGDDANFSTTVTNSLSQKVNSNASAVANSSAITNIVSLTQANYDALASTDSSTLYVIQG